MIGSGLRLQLKQTTAQNKEVGKKVNVLFITGTFD